MRKSVAQFALGVITAVLLLTIPAEWYLRTFPARDFQLYLGDDSSLAGPYLADPDFGVTYRSWEAFYAGNANAIEPFLPFDGHGDRPPLWAFFGNSFVQAPGMLADHTRLRLPDHRIFNLGRNEDLIVRLAQIRLLLEQGLRPARIFVELMPVDMLVIGVQPLATIHVTNKGALTYRPRLPGSPFDWLVQHSALARAAWFRIGAQRGNPAFNKNTLYEGLEEPLLSDLRTVFAHLAHSARAFRVPVTIVLIPSYHQVLAGASYGFQDTLTAMLGALGFDIEDPRAAFAAHPTPADLFSEDKHLSAAGNELLLSDLLAHVHTSQAKVGSPDSWHAP